MALLDPFHAVWCVDFEFIVQAGTRPVPVCMVARELRSGRLLRVWKDELGRSSEPPFPVDDRSLFVAYYAPAELSCFLELGWPVPSRVLDLYPEFRCRTSGLETPCGSGLLGALAWYGLDALDAAEKDSMRALVLRGGPWTDAERPAILDYCQTDVDALARLLPRMAPDIDLPRALLRGRYMAAVAAMERRGVPIDIEALADLRANWTEIQGKLVARVDQEFGVYDGRTFKADRFAGWLAQNNIPWPVLDSGRLALDDDTFREQAKAYPQVASLRELRHTMGQLRLNDLTVGPDGRNRCMMSPFRSKTGRNQPSNSAFIFGPSTWLRSLIRPAPGTAVAYIDWSQQELAIAAALSGDTRMQQAYLSDDFYLSFAKMAGAVPESATKETHAAIRDQFKVVSLGVLYGLSAEGLSLKLGQPPIRGRELLGLHKRTFPRFWAWSDAVQDTAMLSSKLQTVFGWTVRAGADANPRSLRNFPMQGNGAEMMRLACMEAVESGIGLCCPVHDALLIEAPTHEIDAAVAATQTIMQKAGEIVLGGFPLRTDAAIVKHPSRYSDKRGRKMWEIVRELSEEINRERQYRSEPIQAAGWSNASAA